MRTNDGGLAFPSVFTIAAGTNRQDGTLASSAEQHVHGGMTLRDYFAGQALAGLMANPQHARIFHPSDDTEYVYRIADAMIAARTPVPPEGEEVSR